MSRLHSLIYISRPRPGISHDDIGAILRSAREKNERAGLTGFLAFNADTFLQVLEGQASAVSECLTRLMRDPRHSQVELLSYGPIDARTFPDWGMGYAALNSRHGALLARYCGSGTLSREDMTPNGARLLLEELSAEVMMAAPMGAVRPPPLSASSTRSPAA